MCNSGRLAEPWRRKGTPGGPSLNSTPGVFLMKRKVIIHFLDKDLLYRSLLISIPQVRGYYSEENIAEAVISIIERIDVRKLGYFYTCWNCISILLCAIREGWPSLGEGREHPVGHLQLAHPVFFLMKKEGYYAQCSIASVVPFNKTNNIKIRILSYLDDIAILAKLESLENNY